MPWIANVAELEAVKFHKDLRTVCISITEPGRSANLTETSFAAILRLQITDFDPASRAAPSSAILFQEGHAKLIKEFVDVWYGHGVNILVHCAAGISRSGAVVEVLTEYLSPFGYEDKGNLKYPNQHIKNILRRELGLIPEGAKKTD